MNILAGIKIKVDKRLERFDKKVPIRKHRIAKGSLSYHNRTQKKWNKRYGYKTLFAIVKNPYNECDVSREGFWLITNNRDNLNQIIRDNFYCLNADIFHNVNKDGRVMLAYQRNGVGKLIPVKFEYDVFFDRKDLVDPFKTSVFATVKLKV